MSRESADIQSVHRALFARCCFNARALRDIIAYTNNGTKIEWRHNPSVSSAFLGAIELAEHRVELERWWNIQSDTWRRLGGNDNSIHPGEKNIDRTIGELMTIFTATDELLRSLEGRLFSILLRQHQQASVQ